MFDQAKFPNNVSQSVSYRGREDFPSVLHAPDDVVVDVVDACPGMNIFTHTDIIVRKCQEVNYHHCFILYIYFQIYIAGAFLSDTSNRDFPRPFIKQAEADREANDAKMESEMQIAQKRNELAIKQAELKKDADIKQAEADAAYKIQEREQAKTLETADVNAQIARAEREAELKEKQVLIAKQALDAEVRAQADAERYSKSPFSYFSVLRNVTINGSAFTGAWKM